MGEAFLIERISDGKLFVAKKSKVQIKIQNVV